MKLQITRREILGGAIAVGAAWACGEVAIAPSVTEKHLKDPRDLRALATSPRNLILTRENLILYALGMDGAILAIPRAGGPVRTVAKATVLSMAQALGKVFFVTFQDDQKQDARFLRSVGLDGSENRVVYQAVGGRDWNVSSSSQHVGWSDSNRAFWTLDGSAPRMLSSGPGDFAQATDLGMIWEPVSPYDARILRLTDWDGNERIVETLPQDGAGAFGVGSQLLFADRKGFRRLMTGKADDYLPYGELMANRAGWATDGERLVWSKVTRVIDQGNYKDLRSTVYMAYPARPSVAPVVLLEDVRSVSDLAVDARGIAWVENILGPEYATPILMMADFV
jgi:hypothetical protein